MTLPKHIQDAIAAGEADREEFIRKIREADEEKRAQERRWREEYVAKLAAEAAVWFVEQLPKDIRAAIKTGGNFVSLGRDSEGKARADVCRANGMTVSEEYVPADPGMPSDGYMGYSAYTLWTVSW